MRVHKINKDTEIGTEIICIGNNAGFKEERELSKKLLKVGKTYHLHWYVNQPLPYPLPSIDVVFVQEFIGIAFPSHCFSLIGENTLKEIKPRIK